MKTRTAKLLGIGLWFLVASAATAWRVEAAPILQYGSNYYELVLVADPFTGANNTWATAEAAAAASVFGGVNGHLATVGLQGENDFLASLSPGGFGGFAGAWLGGTALTNQWLVGPGAPQAFTYTNWGGSEPNNAGYAYMNIGNLFAGIAFGTWADDSGIQGSPDPSNDPVVGYFVEYESPNVVAPEPATTVLVGLGMLGLGAIRRQRQR